MAAFLTVITTMLGVFAFWLVVLLWRRQLDPTQHHWNGTLPVLGGSEPGTHAWNRFHLRYYAMTLLFIAFEMEMMFMYPWAVVYVREGVKALLEMGMFLAILSIGILYAWREGALRWQ